MKALEAFCQTREARHFQALSKQVQRFLQELALGDPYHPLTKAVLKAAAHQRVKGPIRLDVFRKGLQEVCLFYDDHTVRPGNKCPGISLAEFLEETVNLNISQPGPIDLFLEIPHLYSHYRPNNGYINDVRNRLFVDTKNKPRSIPNLRTHTFDLRWGYDDSYNWAFRGMEKKKKELYRDYLLDYLTSVEESFGRDTFELGIPQIDLPEKLAQSLFELYLAKVQEYINDKEVSIREAVRTGSSKMLEKIFIRLGARYVDYFLLSFLFQRLLAGSDKVIIFTGDYHAYNYREFFLLQGWKNTYTSEGPQCLDISDLPQPLFRAHSFGNGETIAR